MDELVRHIIVVIVPLVVANSLHMVVVKRNLMGFTNESIWIWGFGRNKTWRGFLFVPTVNALIVAAIGLIVPTGAETPALLGFILGLAYMISELPNSFLKRRLGLPPGETHGRFGLAFSIIDKTDSAIGVVLAYVLLGHATWQTGLWLLLIASLTHVAVSLLLVALRIKSAF